MTKETLSDKRKELFDIMIKKMPTAGRIYRIIKQQDREFIQKLKDKAIWIKPNDLMVHVGEIDNLAGEELSNHSSQESKRDIERSLVQKCQMVTGYGSPANNQESKDKPLKKDICANCGRSDEEHECKKFEPLTPDGVHEIRNKKKGWKCLVCEEDIDNHEMCKCMRDYKKIPKKGCGKKIRNHDGFQRCGKDFERNRYLGKWYTSVRFCKACSGDEE